MAAIRTQREIRQRAPIWLVVLLLTNLVIMAVDARDSLRHRERFSRSGDAEQDLMTVAAVETLDELGNRARLISRQLEVGDEVEAVVHGGHVNP